MANGWAEFNKRIKALLDGGRLEPSFSAVWPEFVRLSEASPQAQLLLAFKLLAQSLPALNRVALAYGLSSLLAPVEWPPEWEAERPRLVEGLEHVLRVIAPHQADSFAGLLALEHEEEAAHATGYAVLQCALNLLRPPCRRDQLRVVARLCNLGQTTCQQAYRRALARRAGTIASGPLQDARTRYVVAFEHYALAARALNSAVGAVIFEGLDARLELPGV